MIIIMIIFLRFLIYIHMTDQERNEETFKRQYHPHPNYPVHHQVNE
jgi:hypothetical protein